LLSLIVAAPSPAYAYGDPTGGQLFQILAPLLAVIWGAWLIFANNVRKRVGSLFRWITGAKAPAEAIEPDPNANPGAGPNAD